MHTYQHGHVYSPFIRHIIHLDQHNPDSDGVPRFVAISVRLNEGEDILKVDGEARGLGKNLTALPEAKNCQIQWRVWSYGGWKLEK